MNRRIVLALAAIGTLALPTTATASSPASGPAGKGLTNVYFTADASDGFKLFFSATSGPGRKDEQASFSFSHGTQSVQYTVHARTAIDGNHIEGDFGKFGSFSGTFTGKINDGHGCKPFVRRKTEFSGTLDVEGEHGFATAELRKAEGRLMALVKDPDCTGPTPKPKRDVKSKQVQLMACPAKGSRLYAHLDRRRGDSAFQVNTIEHHGKLLIGRTAYANGGENDFDVAADLEEATLEPGGPFSGSASFADGRLTGDLAVTQLGLSDPVVLTPAAAGIASGRERPGC